VLSVRPSQRDESKWDGRWTIQDGSVTVATIPCKAGCAVEMNLTTQGRRVGGSKMSDRQRRWPRVDGVMALAMSERRVWIDLGSEVSHLSLAQAPG
jgi:hypothetical protein